MIQYTKGNLLDASSQALINTVNTVGIMGKGIALQFKETYPNNFRQYVNACKSKWLQPGRLLIVKESTLYGEKIIINFPTKTEWYKKSKYEFIEAGLQALRIELQKGEISSIAIPPLGCGNGGLQWNRIKALIEKYLSNLSDIEITIFEPNELIKELLRKKEANKNAALTPARAMLLYAMFHYEALGEPNSLFIANKLAWFLQRLGENLKLNFTPSRYGPYSDKLGYVLHSLNGKYLKGLEQRDTTAFETIELNYDYLSEIEQYMQKELKTEQHHRLVNLLKLIDGFQSALSLEILATVDYIEKEKSTSDANEIIQAIKECSNRKRYLFPEKYIHIAIEHLDKYRSQISLT